MDLRDHALKLQRLEDAATEKAGLRARLIDEAALMGKDGKAYGKQVVEQILADIQDEATGAATLGMELSAAIEKAR